MSRNLIVPCQSPGPAAAGRVHHAPNATIDGRTAAALPKISNVI
jgi:hypothetical protein